MGSGTLISGGFKCSYEVLEVLLSIHWDHVVFAKESIPAEPDPANCQLCCCQDLLLWPGLCLKFGRLPALSRGTMESFGLEGTSGVTDSKPSPSTAKYTPKPRP